MQGPRPQCTMEALKNARARELPGCWRCCLCLPWPQSASESRRVFLSCVPLCCFAPQPARRGHKAAAWRPYVPPSEKYASARFPLLARVRDKPAALRLRGAVRVQAGPGKPRSRRRPPVAPACMMACAAPQGAKQGACIRRTIGGLYPLRWAQKRAHFSPLIFPLYAAIESRIKGRRMPPEAAKQAENPTESGA